MESLVKLLYSVANLAGVQLAENQLQFLDRGCPHHPFGLPLEKWEFIYFFLKRVFEAFLHGRFHPKYEGMRDK